MVRKLFFVGMVATFLSSCTVGHSIYVTNNAVGSKKGVVKSKIFGSTDISFEAAAKAGKISKIGTAEVKTKMILIFPVTTITVTGE